MTSIAILGGGIGGLSAALMLARAGHDVIVLERDPQPIPPSLDQAADWHRPTVPQTAHAQSVLGLGRKILARRLPDVLVQLLAAGAGEYPLGDGSDPDLVSLGVRRTTLEWVLRRSALAEPRVQWRPGVLATDLLWRRVGSVPQVLGVHTREHCAVRADLVLDATGRHSQLPRWLRAAGAEPDEVSHDCELTAYSRFFRLRDGVPVPPMLGGNATVITLDGLGCYAFRADDRTIAVAVGRLPGDRHLIALQDPSCFDAVVAGIPAVADLVDPDRVVPISGVAVLGGLRNTFRSPLCDGRAQIHGLHAIGDALATTNPTFGRGVSLALAHAEAVTDGVSAEPDRPDLQADLVARRLVAVTRPVWTDSVRHDQHRIFAWRRTVGLPTGRPPTPRAVSMLAGVRAGLVDPDIAVRVQRAIHLLDAPGTVFDNSALAARISRLPLPELPPQGDRAQALLAVSTLAGAVA